MIDFVKILYKDKSEFEPYVNDPDNFPELIQVLERHSGEIRYPHKTNLETMDVVIAQKYGYIKNSLHKLYNYLVYRENANYNDFTYSNLCESIEYLGMNLPDIAFTGITQLEFGFNICVSKPAEQIIRENVLMHKYKNYNHNKQYDGKGELKRFDHSNYLVKIYDKAKQYSKEFDIHHNILRFEIRHTRRRDLNDLGVFNLNDLRNKDNLQRLFENAIMRFDKMQIIDSILEESIEPEDFQKLIRFKNPEYWQEEIKEKSGTFKMRRRNEFNALIEKYSLNSTKNELRRLLIEKFNHLINN
ncbi:hypothetical protein [Flavobacterium litorale]|uniref:RelA/SpoT domain-containing protein n=1 Tax=Flavobacterium litorale TaxID=2856519 RepID=A0ABX8VDS0_9FLAO|nr:hypothetical protein [Flavobacterium litorale]QYJ68786.1 hypothetical protein K1I41_02585 [Flavobacterium litorale]